MKKLNIRKLNAHFLLVLSLAWRLALLLICMFACLYVIEETIGFTWWLVMGKSGAVLIIFETVVVAVFCAVRLEVWESNPHLATGCKEIGWCWDFELADYLRTHSVLPNV